MAIKKKTKRPPRAVWLTFWSGIGPRWAVHATKRLAVEFAQGDDRLSVVGPYILAERVRQR